MMMKEVDFNVFDTLFREACLKCYGHPPAQPLTETESKLMYTRIFDATGLVIGWKSIKNYSLFVLSPGAAKPENPSVATLDTLSRYVMGAPYTTEPERKKEAGHYPYWYEYKARWVERGAKTAEGAKTVREAKRAREAKTVREAKRARGAKTVAVDRKRGRLLIWRVAAGVVVAAFLVAGMMLLRRAPGVGFANNFREVSMDSLRSRGWWVEAPDTSYWKKRGLEAGCLTLYTMRGDNWPDPVNRPAIRNLLMHRIDCDCWTVEVHLKDFIPAQDWQQAGILLMEDSSFNAKSMRVSISFNDYNGIYPRSGTVLVQGIASRGKQGDKPEEFVHFVILQTDSVRNHPDLYQVLVHSALRIEKRGDLFRILYADGISANTSFKEISSYEFRFRPRYVGLFALRGYVDTSAAVPARFTYFSLDCCTP